MTDKVIYSIATILTWMGWFSLLRAVWFGVSLSSPGNDRGALIQKLISSSLMAGVGLLVGSIFARPEHGGFGLPLVWFVMPWSAWLIAIGSIITIARLIQAYQGITSEEKSARLKGALIPLIATVLGMILYWHWVERLHNAVAASTDLLWVYEDNKIVILKGSIVLSPEKAVAVIALAVAAVGMMAFAGRAAKSRGVSKAIVSQIALIAGSIVFGLPFAFLVITSFKEDRDMSSPNGIVWVPRVQQTVPYFDPKDPLYEATYEGNTVQGNVIERRQDGTVRVDIFKPMSIRGITFDAKLSALKEIPKEAPVVSADVGGIQGQGMIVEEMEDGRKRVKFLRPETVKDKEAVFEPAQVEPVREVGLRWQNYPEALSFLPPETHNGLVYLKNTLILVVFSVIGTILSSSIVAYAFSRMKFPGQKPLFAILLSTMMLPGAVTLLPQFLIFRQLGWIDTLYPLWVPAFFGSAFNIFLLRQFFLNIPMELEDAAKIDGCSYLKTFWSVMLPQIKPALAVIAIWTLMGAWNNFMGPLIYVNSPEQMPLSYALQLFQGDRASEPGLLMAFATLCMLPVLALFFFAQRYFIEGVTLSGLGGR